MLGGDNRSPICKWKVKENGEMPCPPEEMGGCGNDNLLLKCMFGQNWVSNLKKKVENLVLTHEKEHLISNECCSCYQSVVEIDGSSKNLRKTACREDSSDNYLYCPLASDIEQRDLEHFQKHWVTGAPVIVRDVLDLTPGLSWEPMVMWRAVREIKYKTGSSDLDVTAVDCLDWCEVIPPFCYYLSSPYHYDDIVMIINLSSPRNIFHNIDCGPVDE